MSWLTLLLIAAGFVLLVVGAEVLIGGASRLAASIGVSPLVVGLTVVSFGTSTPELAVSLASAAQGSADLALGNVVGSNIFNVLFILGLSALVTPLVVSQKLLRLEVPLMIGSAGLVWLLGLDGRIGRVEGVLFGAAVIGYTVFVIRQSRRESSEIQEQYAQELGKPPNGARALSSRWVQVASICAGLLMLVLGSQLLVDNAVLVARALGVTELVIGLTVIAVGTSLPEVATSVMASVRGERDIAVGNVVGSNIFNVLAVLGFSSALSPEGIAVSGAALSFDVPIMLAASVACLPIFLTGGRISRAEGAVFLGYYVAYIAYVVLSTTGHSATSSMTRAMLWFVLPLTALTLVVTAANELRRGKA